MFQRYLTAVLLVICTSIYVYGQDKITGIIVDADDNYGIPYASVSYKGHHVAVSCDGEGSLPSTFIRVGCLRLVPLDTSRRL